MIALLILIVVIALTLWLLESLPLGEPWRTLIRVVAVLIVVVYLLRFAGFAAASAPAIAAPQAACSPDVCSCPVGVCVGPNGCRCPFHSQKVTPKQRVAAKAAPVRP